MGKDPIKQNITRPKQGEIIFEKGATIDHISMIVEGSVLCNENGFHTVYKAGELIGSADLYEAKFEGQYVANEDSILFSLPVMDEISLETFIESNEAYRGGLIYTLTHLYTVYYNKFKRLSVVFQEACAHFEKHLPYIQKEEDFQTDAEKLLSKIQPLSFSKEPEEEEEMKYLADSAAIHMADQKAYFRHSEYMTLYQASKLNSYIVDLRTECYQLKDMFADMLVLFTNLEDVGLLQTELSIAKCKSENGGTDMGTLTRINETKEEIADVAVILEELGILPASFSLDVIDKIVDETMKYCSEVGGGKDSSDNIDLTQQLLDSLNTILSFSEVDDETAENMRNAMHQFELEPDKMVISDEMRALKRTIQTHFFTIYENCEKKWIQNKNVPLPVELFLYFGYMDERLVSSEHLKHLYSQLKEIQMQIGESNVYYMPEWLDKIYHGEKEPSRNAFEQDYPDYLREQKKHGEITEKEQKELLEDNDAKLHFEIENLFVQTNKTVNGQITTYVPILYNEQIYGNLQKLFLSRKVVVEMLKKVEELDISAYMREVTYRNEALEIEREQVKVKIYPEIIIAPVYGTSGVMWQEISGKRRNTPGRIVFPAFEESDFYKLMLTQVGRLRWEYVRREMGADWNNIQFKSLTSEYSDYLQFYRKNRELSEELRAKVKTQIQKARNNFREVFVADYIVWIESESSGAMKLNRVAREILATYCPFPKEVRNELKANGMFERAMKRQQKEFNEQTHMWEMKIRKRENHGDEVPEEFYGTYEFYSNS